MMRSASTILFPLLNLIQFQPIAVELTDSVILFYMPESACIESVSGESVIWTGWTGVTLWAPESLKFTNSKPL